MKLELSPPRAVRRIAERLEEAGHETWAVGGAVRDALLGLPSDDWDLATRARPREVRRLFRRTVPIGIEHGTVGVLAERRLYEVTTFRRDVETFGRHAVVEFADTIEEDLARRDFTLNALAWHPLSRELRDPFRGAEDLRARCLRTVGRPADRFAEDYLRVLRALRFTGHFDLTIERDTWSALCEATPHLTRLSAERVREELWKILAQTRPASRALSLYAAAGALRVILPELEATVGLRGASPLEATVGLRDGESTLDAWTVALLAVDAIPPARTRLRAAALLHAVGMPAARSRDLRGGWRYTGHEKLGGRMAGEILRRLRSSNADVERVSRLVAHQSDLFPPDSPPAVIRRWLRHVGADLVHDLFRLRFALWRAASAGVQSPPDLSARARAARAVLRSRPPLSVQDLAIGGEELRSLGLRPGPEYGRILHALLDRVSADPDLNARDALMDIVRREYLGE